MRLGCRGLFLLGEAHVKPLKGTSFKQNDCSVHFGAAGVPLQMHRWGAPASGERPVGTIQLYFSTVTWGSGGGDPEMD